MAKHKFGVIAIPCESNSDIKNRVKQRHKYVILGFITPINGMDKNSID